MCKSNIRMQASSRREQGAVLMVALVMLLILTILGLSTAQSTNLGEKMASNMRELNVALQTAESGLRDAERLTLKQVEAPIACESSCATSEMIVEQNAMGTLAAKKDPAWWAANAREYGMDEGGTDGSDMPPGNPEPRYLAEQIPFTNAPLKLDNKNIGGGVDDFSGVHYYRFTGAGQGGNDKAFALVESVFLKRY